MIDYSDIFPVEPIIGWTTTNYKDRSKNGEVQQFQGFKGCNLDGGRLPHDYYDQNAIAVPEGRFHTSEAYFQPTPDQAIKEAIERVKCLNDECERILASVRQVQAQKRRNV